MGRIGWLALSCAGALALAGAITGCERGASAPSRAHRDEGGGRSSYASQGGSSDGGGARGGGRDDDGGSRSGDGGGRSYGSADDSGRGGGEREREETPLFHGKPMWADNRRHTAKENAEYQCDKHGDDIGSKSLDDCLTKVHAFVDDPPQGAEVVTRVRNGDRLLYDAKANMFAVARKDGAPRTFFKPREGADYWREQKEQAQSGRSGERSGGSRGAADEGSGSGGG